MKAAINCSLAGFALGASICAAGLVGQPMAPANIDAHVDAHLTYVYNCLAGYKPLEWARVTDKLGRPLQVFGLAMPFNAPR
jgi:hypothetical protein